MSALCSLLPPIARPASPTAAPGNAASCVWSIRLTLGLIALWVALGCLLNSSQWGDHFEQFIWAHSVEWGYHKHPPLPTWMLAACIGLFGAWPYWTYLLAGLCTAGTALFTHAIAVRLIGAPAAAVAILLWGLQQSFSVRAQLFNHNTVMMLTVSCTVWTVLRAVDAGQRRWWGLAGAAAGLAMLSKYQSVAPLAGVVAALMLSGELRRPVVRRGLLLAVGVATLVVVPHLLWVVQHDFSTLGYAARQGHTMSWADKGVSVVSFALQQVRLTLPALLLAGLLWLACGRRRPSADPPIGDADLSGRRRAWFTGLIVCPLAITVLTCPAFGLGLQNHWGYQCLQFVALWLAWRLRRAAAAGTAVLAALALAMQALSLAVNASPPWVSRPNTDHRVDTSYPAQQLADAVAADWHAVTLSPLDFVIGPTFEAGMVSVYMRQPPSVLESGDYRKSPWIRPEDVACRGAVHVATMAADLPGSAVLVNSLDAGAGHRIYWAVVPPGLCGAAQPDRSALLL